MSKKTKQREPEFLPSPLHNPMPNYKVYYPNAAERLLVFVVCFALGGLTGLVFYGGLFKADGNVTTATLIADAVAFCVVGFFANKFLSPMYWARCLNNRKQKLKKQFRDMLEALSASFSSGSNVQGAFESALVDLGNQYDESEFIVMEMREIVVGVRQNIDISLMLKNFAERSGNEDIASFADVFTVCYQKGGNMNSVIHRTNTVISDKMAIADEIETKLTSNKMQHNVMSLMPIPIVAMLKFTNDAFSSNFATPKGVLVNTIAIVIFVLAYKYGLKIVDIKE